MKACLMIEEILSSKYILSVLENFKSNCNDAYNSLQSVKNCVKARTSNTANIYISGASCVL